MSEVEQKQKFQNVTVLGGGSFGTAMSLLFARNGVNVMIIDRSPERCHIINTEHRNDTYLTHVKLPENIKATTDSDIAFANADLVFHAVPVQNSKEALLQHKKAIGNTPVISMSKGIHSESLQLMCDIMGEVFGPDHLSAYISGPSFAAEICDNQPTGFTIASTNLDFARDVASVLSRDKLVRCYLTSDIIGVEFGGALKNVYAIASGILEGSGYKYNTTCLLITRGLHEMIVLAHKAGGKPETFLGLSGVGDLVLTTMGGASRNKTFGVAISQREKTGKDMNAILGEMETVEGVYTLESAKRLAERYGVLKDMPILLNTYRMVYENVSVEECIARMMRGSRVSEEITYS